MAETLAVRGFGLVLSVGDAAGVVFTPILEVIDFVYPQGDSESADVTHHQSPNARREKLRTFLVNGEGTFKINWVPDDASHVIIADLRDSGDVRKWRAAFPSDPVMTHEFSAFVKRAIPASPIDAQLTMDVTLESTGDITEV